MSREQEPVGSLGVEAAKLLAALQDWAKDSGGEYVEAATAAASGAATGLHDLDEHLATGGPDCCYCPVCRVISAVRGTSPEVKAHLRLAATSLVDAAAGMLATHTGTSGAQEAGRRGSPVEKIDLDPQGDGTDDDNEWEDD